MSSSLLATLLTIAAVPTLAGLTYLTVTAGQSLRTWLTAKASTSLFAREALVLEQLAEAIVTDIETNEKAALEARSSGGPLTEGDYRQLKDLALTRLKAVLAARGPDTLKGMLGALVGTPALEQVLSGKIEQAVAKVSSPK